MMDNNSNSVCINNNTLEWEECAGCSSFDNVSIWKTLIIFVVSFLAIPSNLLVMLVIWNTASLRNNQSIYMLSLAVSGMGTGLCFLAFGFRYAVTGHGPASPFELDMASWLYYVMITATLIITLCIGLDKLHQIKWSFSYDRHMTSKVVIGIVLSIWFLLFILSAMPTRIVPIAGYYYNFTGDTMMFDTKFCNKDSINLLVIIRISMFIIMFVVLVGGYGTILAISRRHIRKMRQQMQVNIPLVQGAKADRPVNNNRRELKGWITSACVILVFLVCWLPFFLYKIIIAKPDETSNSPNFYLAWFAMIHTSVNVAIYGGTYKPFRKGMRKFIMIKVLRRSRRNDDFYTSNFQSRKNSDFISKNVNDCSRNNTPRRCTHNNNITLVDKDSNST